MGLRHCITAFILAASSLASADPPQPPLKVGAFLPLTGEYAHFGEAARNGIELARRRTGAREVEIVYEDNRSCGAREAKVAFSLLVERHKVDAIISFCTASVPILAPLAAAAKIPLIQTTESLFDDRGTVMKMMPTSIPLTCLMGAQHARKYSRIALIANSMEVNTGPSGAFELFTRAFEQRGGSVVFRDDFPDDTTDFRTLINRLKGSGAQAVSPYIWNARQLALFLRQADELALWDSMKLAGNFTFEMLFDELKTLYPPLLLRNGLESANYTDTTAAWYRQEYQKRYGEAAPQFSDYNYDALLLLQECGADRECMKRPQEGASGAIVFDQAMRRKGSYSYTELRDGVFVRTVPAQGCDAP